jgi:hypothetical protein
MKMMQKYSKWFIHDNLYFSQMSQASPLKENLAYSLVPLYFSLRQVSLAEYLLVLRALFPMLLQMVRCIMVTASTIFIQRWATTRTMGMVTPYVSSTAFVGLDHYLALYLN